jgi:hypothetical protein
MTGSVKQYCVRQNFNLRTSSSLIIRMTFLLFVSLSTVILVVNVLAKHLNAHDLPDPFIAFANVMPGQSMDTLKLEAQGFSCHDNTLPSPADISQDCMRAVPTGSFSHINLTIWDGVIQWLDLKVREHDLNVGDLSLRWGSPEVRIEGNWVHLSWPNRHVTGLGWSHNGQFTYFQALSYITFVV